MTLKTSRDFSSPDIKSTATACASRNESRIWDKLFPCLPGTNCVELRNDYYYNVPRFQRMARRGGSRYASKLFGCSLPI